MPSVKIGDAHGLTVVGVLLSAVSLVLALFSIAVMVLR